MAVPDLPHSYDVEIVGLAASPGHRYDGRPGGAVPEQAGDSRAEIEVRGGYGVVGDRYAGRPAHRDAQLTELSTGPLDPLLAARTVVLRGAEVVRLRGGRPAHPCAWLDTVFAPDAHRGLRGRAGIRCAALSDGVLRLGRALLRSAVPWTRPPLRAVPCHTAARALIAAGRDADVFAVAVACAHPGCPCRR
jgi:hypothetical protein